MSKTASWVAPWQAGVEDGARYVQDNIFWFALGCPDTPEAAVSYLALCTHPNDQEYQEEYRLGFLAGYVEASR